MGAYRSPPRPFSLLLRMKGHFPPRRGGRRFPKGDRKALWPHRSAESLPCKQELALFSRKLQLALCHATCTYCKFQRAHRSPSGLLLSFGEKRKTAGGMHRCFSFREEGITVSRRSENFGFFREKGIRLPHVRRAPHSPYQQDKPSLRTNGMALHGTCRVSSPWPSCSSSFPGW